LDLLVRKSPAQNAAAAAAADFRGADDKKEDDLKLKAALSPLQQRVRLLSFLDNTAYYLLYT
jgi:hypothetical protein